MNSDKILNILLNFVLMAIIMGAILMIVAELS